MPGGYEWRSDDINSKSVFAGDGLVSSLIKQSWERFKFGGQPGGQQLAFFVSLKELPDNRFGTQSEIYWDDGFLNTQVGAVTRGSYTLKIIDPILFVKNFVPAKYLQPGEVFDFTDIDNAAASQLFNEVVGSLAPAFSLYTNDPGKGNRITKLQQDSEDRLFKRPFSFPTAPRTRQSNGRTTVEYSAEALEPAFGCRPKSVERGQPGRKASFLASSTG